MKALIGHDSLGCETCDLEKPSPQNRAPEEEEKRFLSGSFLPVPMDQNVCLYPQVREAWGHIGIR